MKLTGKIIIFLLSFLLIFSLAACEKVCIEHNDSDGDGKCDACGTVCSEVPPEGGGEEGGEEEPPVEESVKLIEDGVANFKIVTQKGSGSFVKAVDNLVKDLKGLDVIVEKVYDEQNNLSDCEVLIGVPQYRGDAYKYDIYSLGEKGYAIKLIDGKILIVGGSEAALIEAVEVFEEDFLGITKKTKELTDVTVKKSQDVEKIQDNYRITALKLNGEDMRGYTIAADQNNEYALNTALAVQSLMYQKTGYRFEIVSLNNADKSIVIEIVENTYEGDGYYITVNESTIEFKCEFPDVINEKVLNFFTANVSVAQGEVNFTSAHNATENVRDIFYSDFGAVGDGINDDFKEIKACHDYANLWGHTVNATRGKTYYIGKENAGESVIVQTDVNWNNCKFIFDDSNIAPYVDADGKEVWLKTTGVRVKENPTRSAPIFWVSSASAEKSLTAEELQGKTLRVGDTNIGFAPGYAALVYVQNNNIKHYIRYGVNANSGNAQQEAILVDKNGNIDPSTPVVWNYDVITSLTIYSIEDRPITLKNAAIDTIANTAPNYYTSYARHIYITRSHTTVENIDHSLLNEGETRAPYSGVASPYRCYNVTIKNVKVQHHENRYDADTGALLGTYEFGGTGAIAPKWINCYQKNFFDADGKITYKGLFGTNYCRNVYLEGCFLNSFDAHCGLTNATIKNSTFEHMNFIGNGDIVIENVNVYCDGTKGSIINLRTDYGSTWNGDVYLKNVHLKYMQKRTDLSLVAATYTDHNFGYTCYLPQNFYIENITSAYVAPTKASSGRLESEETVIEQNTATIHLCTSMEDVSEDISKLKSEGGDAMFNAYIGTKTVHISGTSKVPKWVFPNTPQFKDMKVYINDEEIEDWKILYGSRK